MIEPSKLIPRPDSARLLCRSCGEAVEFSGDPGSVAQLRFEHEADCAFFKAIESGRGQEWIEKNGDPIRMEAAESEAKP